MEDDAEDKDEPESDRVKSIPCTSEDELCNPFGFYCTHSFLGIASVAVIATATTTVFERRTRLCCVCRKSGSGAVSGRMQPSSARVTC